MNQAKEQLIKQIDSMATELFAVSDYIHDNPELAYCEVKASDCLCRFLKEKGFRVDKGIGGLETAFKASMADRKHIRPMVAFLAEYDAVAGTGHSCGHNMIGAASVGAAVALAYSLTESAAGVSVIGTPAEEGGGGKAILAEAGVFEEIDAAMMFHPGQRNTLGLDLLGRVKFKMEFFGKSAHPADVQAGGVNALDAMVLAYNAMNSLRQHLRGDAYIHGIVTQGGVAPNAIPDYAAGVFYVRAPTRAYRDELFERVKKCAEGAALATGASFKVEIQPPVIDPMVRNKALEHAFQSNMEILGFPLDPPIPPGPCSDIGNLSYYVPAIQPMLRFVGHDVPHHSHAFHEVTTSSRSGDILLNGAKLLAMTAYDYLTSPALRRQVAEEFNGIQEKVRPIRTY